MELERRRTYVTSLITAFVLGACADGAKLQSELGRDGAEAGAGGQAGEGAGGFATAGATAYVPSSGGLSYVSKATTRTNANGGTQGGSNVGGGGGWLPSDGGAASSGGTTSSGGATSNVSAPTSGLAVAIQELADVDHAIAIRLSLINFGPDSVALSAIKLRYFFTLDAPADLHFEVYYKNHVDTVKSAIEVIEAADADRYLDLSFEGPMLGVGAENALSLAGSLHDSTWATTMVGSNDYSFVPLVGYCDRITVYQNGRLAWGTEPKTSGDPYNGVGGNKGTGGTAGTSSSGSGGGSVSGGTSGATAAGGTGTGTSTVLSSSNFPGGSSYVVSAVTFSVPAMNRSSS